MKLLTKGESYSFRLRRVKIVWNDVMEWNKFYLCTKREFITKGSGEVYIRECVIKQFFIWISILGSYATFPHTYTHTHILVHAKKPTYKYYIRKVQYTACIRKTFNGFPLTLYLDKYVHIYFFLWAENNKEIFKSTLRL